VVVAAALLCGVVVAQAPAPAQTQAPAATPAPVIVPAEPPAAANAGEGQTVHVLVGHSIVVRTEARLKRVLVGNAAVVGTTTTSPNEVVVTALSPGSSSVVLWQEDNSSRIIEVFADVDVSLLRDALQRGFPGEAVQAEAEEGRVVITGTVSSQPIADQVLKMAAPFSKDVVNSLRVALPGRQKQILLRVKFAEVDRTKLEAFGFNLLSTGATNTIGSVTTQQFGNLALGENGRLTSQIGASPHGFTTQNTISDLLNIFVFRPDLNLGATIRDLQSRNVLQILAEPNLLAASGEPAKFLAGGELPYPVVQGTTGGTTVSVQFKPFGVKLEFTGTLEGDNIIRLKVFPEVSSLDFANAVTISGFVLPAIATRHAETVVELKDGQSFGIAGLLDNRTTMILSKVPGIADIPILGQLFKSRSVNRTNTELMVIVTPSIVDPAAPGNNAAPELPKPATGSLVPSEFDKKIPQGDGSKKNGSK
jgi:pilus assembly protein CpaC